MRPLRRTPVPPGAAGLRALIGPVTAALAGTGPAVAPVPTTTVTVSNEYVARILSAIRPDDPDAPLESDGVAVVLSTSGSTGAPRGVLLTASALTSLSSAVNGHGTGPTWVAALPLTSLGGFNVLIRALAAGHEPIALASIGGAEPFTPSDFARAVHEASATSSDVRVSLVAAQVRRLMTDEAGIEALRACSQVLVGAGPLPASVDDAARAAGVVLTRTYGATETSGGCVYDGLPLTGVGIGFASPAPAEVLVTGPMLAAGYRCEPALTAERFTPDGYRTGDLGALDAHGRLSLLGRLDDVVVVNGVNVSLGAVERVVEGCDGVDACVIIAAPEPEGEVELIAFAVAAQPSSGLRASIAERVQDALGRAALPRRVAHMSEFPLLPNRKVDRAALRALAAAQEQVTWLR